MQWDVATLDLSPTLCSVNRFQPGAPAVPVRRQSKKRESLRNLAEQNYHLCTELPTATVEKGVKFPKGAMWRRECSSLQSAFRRASTAFVRSDEQTVRKRDRPPVPC